MLSILVDNAASNEQLTVNITSNFPQYTAKITGIGRNNNKEIFVMSCNFMSCNCMPRNFDGPSFSCPSLSAPPSGVKIIQLTQSADPVAFPYRPVRFYSNINWQLT